MAPKGEPFVTAAHYEVPVLAAVQDMLAGRPGVLPAARGMSHFGEHALGWAGVSAAGALLDRTRRGRWLTVGAGAVGAHAASIVVKRVVRRPRPHDPQIVVGVRTPGRLSFPSSHATSTAAAGVLIGRASGMRPVGVAAIAAALTGPMALSRLVLGVHYPSDVAAGAALGVAGALIADRMRGSVPLLGDAGEGL